MFHFIFTPLFRSAFKNRTKESHVRSKLYIGFLCRNMNGSENDDETMSKNRSEYVNRLLEQNRQVGDVFLDPILVKYPSYTRKNQRKSTK